MRMVLLGIGIFLSISTTQAMNTDADDEPSERLSSIVSTYACNIWNLRFANNLQKSNALLAASYELAYDIAHRLPILRKEHKNKFTIVIQDIMKTCIEDEKNGDHDLRDLDRLLLVYASYKIIGDIEFKKVFLSNSIQQLFLPKLQSFQQLLLKNKQITVSDRRYRLTL